MTQPYYEDDSVTLYHGNSEEILPWITSAQTVITDPPYGLDIAYGRGARTIQGDSDMRLLGWVWGHAARITTDGGWTAVFTDWRGLGQCSLAAVAAGLDVETAIVWDKVMLGMGGSFRPQYEMALIASKNGRTDYNGGNLIRVPRSSTTPDHPHEKPLTLMRRMVLWLSQPGDLVVDPFAGSGTTLRAAKDLGRRAVGIEIEERWCELAAQRLAQEVLLV